MSEHEHNWQLNPGNNTGYGEWFVCECGVKKLVYCEFEDKPQQTSQNIDWEKSYDAMCEENEIHTIGTGDHNLIKQFIRSKKKEWEDEAEKRGQIQGIKMVNLPQYDHRKCLDKRSCIGYQNAESDLFNEKEILLASLTNHN